MLSEGEACGRWARWMCVEVVREDRARRSGVDIEQARGPRSMCAERLLADPQYCGRQLFRAADCKPKLDQANEAEMKRGHVLKSRNMLLDLDEIGGTEGAEQKGRWHTSSRGLCTCCKVKERLARCKNKNK
jgi:hypothetical protein